MKKFSRCVLILILVTVLGAVGGYFYADKVLTPMYSSETTLYVVVDENSEASLRSRDGGLNDDFAMIITGPGVISEAQRTAGTSESIDKYLQVITPANSNIIKIICTNPDANTAKTYVDAVARATVNTLGNTIPVKSVKILSAGTVSSKSYKPEQYTYTATIAGLAAAACLAIEILVLLCMSAFKRKEDNSDDESEYERRYGNVVYIPAGDNFPKSTRRDDDLSNDDHEVEKETIKVVSKEPDKKEEKLIEEPAIKEAAVSLAEPESVYGSEKEHEAQPVYGSVQKEPEPQSVYGSMAVEQFTSDYDAISIEDEAETVMNPEVETVTEPEQIPEPEFVEEPEQIPQPEPEKIAEEPEELPVTDAALQAQQAVSSQYVYKEEENVPSTAEVSSKYLYRGDENYKKPAAETVEKKAYRDDNSGDIDIEDISESPVKEKKKSRIIGIIRK